MISYADVDEQGRLVAWGTGEPPSDQKLAAGATRRVLHGAPLYDGDAFYCVGEALRPKPPQPSPFHAFDYSVAQWRLDTELAWASVRATRDERLLACDWVTLRATEQGEAVPPEWLAYRQALRDITDQADPLNIIWPTPPVA